MRFLISTKYKNRHIEHSAKFSIEKPLCQSNSVSFHAIDVEWSLLSHHVLRIEMGGRFASNAVLKF